MARGVGPESTITYYRRIISGWRAHHPDGSWPAILINSIDLQRELVLVENDHPALVAFMADAVRSLQHAGAHFAFFASNTPHVVFDEVQRRVDLPLLSIVDAARDAAQRSDLRRLALFGTRFTLLQDNGGTGIPFLDTAVIHADAAVIRMLA